VGAAISFPLASVGVTEGWSNVDGVGDGACAPKRSGLIVDEVDGAVAARTMLRV
jgi:hypothetical protein